MPRGYRCILVAFVGWLSLAASEQAVKQANSNKGAEQAQATLPGPPYAAYPDKYSDACYGVQNHDSADLCAQWRAAIAAEKAAHESRRATNWAIAATALSLATVIGLIVTIIQTFRALTEARRGNLIAQRANARATKQAIKGSSDTQAAIRTAERQADAAAEHVKIAQEAAQTELRAYLAVREVATDALESGRRAVVAVRVRNTGRTPARDCLACVGVEISHPEADWVPENFHTDTKGTTFELGSGEEIDIHAFSRGAVTKHVLDQIEAGVSRIYLKLSIEYADVFKTKRRSDFLFRSIVGRDGYEPTGGKKFNRST